MDARPPLWRSLVFFFALINLFSLHGSNALLLDGEFATDRPGEHREERKKDEKTIQQTDIMLISKLARLPIHLRGFLPPLGGPLNTIEKTRLHSHFGVYPINYESTSLYRVVAYRLHAI